VKAHIFSNLLVELALRKVAITVYRNNTMGFLDQSEMPRGAEERGLTIHAFL
jgi:hypothetical protein